MPRRPPVFGPDDITRADSKDVGDLAQVAGTELEQVGYATELIAEKFNNRPRETLGWKTPARALDELLSNPTDPAGVASLA